MRKTLMSVIVVLFAVAFISSAAFAAEAKKAKEPCEPKAKAVAEKVMGTVKSIDQAKGELVVTPDGGGEDMTFSIKKTQAKNVKAGDKVNVNYERSGKGNVAKKVMKARGAKVPVGC